MKNSINIWKRLPQGVKASIALLFANIVSKGIAYITTPLYTRLLTPDDYGQAALFQTWMQVFGIVAMFCLSYGVFNNGMIDYKKDRDGYSLSMLVLSNIITMAFCGVLFTMYSAVRDIIGLDFPFLILMCAIFLVQPAYNFFIARNRYELKYKATVFWTIVAAIVSPLAALVCILNFDNQLYGRIFGAELALIAIYIGFYIYIVLRGRGKFTTKYWKTAFLFNLPLIPHYLSTYLLGSSDKIMISRLIGDTATAYYSVAYSVASIATVVWQAVNSSLIPYTYEKCEKKDYKAISDITLPILTVFAVVSILVILLAPEVVAVMATVDYMEAIYVIPPIVGGVFFQVQYFIYANVIYYYKKPKYVMFASVGATTLNIVLNDIFIPRFGYVAAGYTTIFCYLVQAAADYLALRHVVHEKIYNMRYLGVLSLGVIVIALISTLSYGIPLLRYSIAGAMLIFGVMFRHRLVRIFLSIRGTKKSKA